ncbi:MAG: efflux RND transporter periplasmic adaptor subunit [Rikenellaceae bacterium]
MSKKTINTLLALFSIALVTTSCGEQSAAPQAAKSYKTLSIVPSSTVVSTKYSASIRAEQFVDIRPQVSGVITSIAIEEGAQIKKGQTILVLDQVPYKAALDVASANVKSAEAAVATAKLNYESGESLYREQVISNNELQQLQNTLLAAEAAFVQAQAQETIARNDLSYTVVKSPVDGLAGMINYRVGALVSSSITDPLVSVSNNDKMYAYFSLSESALLNLIEQSGSTEAFIEQMDQVELVLNNGSIYPLKGEVDAISGVIDQSTGAVSVRAVFENPDKILRDGGAGSVRIAAKYDDVIVIPKVATYEIQNKTFVFKIVDGMTSSSQITILPTDNGQEYIVTSGVNLSDVIIAEGAGLLREGTPVATK